MKQNLLVTMAALEKRANLLNRQANQLSSDIAALKAEASGRGGASGAPGGAGARASGLSAAVDAQVGRMSSDKAANMKARLTAKYNTGRGA